MSLQSVEEAARAAEEAQHKLHAECARAAEAGVPQAAIARAAGVARNTAIGWIKQDQDD